MAKSLSELYKIIKSNSEHVWNNFRIIKSLVGLLWALD